MKTMLTLLRREFWENRGAFLTTPIVVGGLFVFITILAMSAAKLFVTKINGQEFVLSQIGTYLSKADPKDLEIGLDLNLLAFVTIFNAALFFVVFFYLLGSLYDDRKDRSILFWRSLPVSDLQTVVSKLISALLIAPAISLVMWFITTIILMILASFMLMGSEVSAMEYIWGPADPLMVMMLLGLGYLVQALWMLPIWGWLVFCSAFAKSKPFLWAVFTPAIVMILESWFNFIQYFNLSNVNFATWVLERFAQGTVPLALIYDDDFQIGGVVEIAGAADASFPLTIGSILGKLTTASLWIGVVIGIGFIAGAIYIRRYRDDT